jgi:hypothetical protein
VSTLTEQVERLREEHRRLVSSMAYAFAMGHPSSIGEHPFYAEVLERERWLRARIAELEA